MPFEDKFLGKVYAAYLNAPVRVNAPHFNPNIYSKNSDGEIIMCPSLLADCHKGAFSFNDFTLKLRPLSEMTDEDAIEVAKWAGCGAHNPVQEGFIVREKYRIKLNFRYKISDNPENWEARPFFINTAWRGETSDYKNVTRNQTFITDILRSRFYDCGYFHLDSLINARIAIKASNDERSVATDAQ